LAQNQNDKDGDAYPLMITYCRIFYDTQYYDEYALRIKPSIMMRIQRNHREKQGRIHDSISGV